MRRFLFLEMASATLTAQSPVKLVCDTFSLMEMRAGSREIILAR